MRIRTNPPSCAGRWRCLALAGVFAMLTAASALGQAVTEAGAPTEAASGGGLAPVFSRAADGSVVIRATRLSEPLKVDGRLDEDVYRRVPSITDFIQQEPVNGAPISEKTEAWVLYDDQNIYLVCRCWDAHPERIVANDMRRDASAHNQHDQFTMTIDTFHDRRNGYLFGMTAIGGMRDAEVIDERPSLSWNGVWDAKVTRFDQGWIGEMAVPFKTLRYAPDRDQTWGIQIRRYMSAKNERAHIVLLDAAAGQVAINQMSKAATLVGLQVPPPGLDLEVKPYLATRYTTDLLTVPNVRDAIKGDGGLDVKYGITKSLTMSATYRTDFAQVEADEAQVNLTRFSLSLPEKREFFLESSGVFNFGAAAGGGDAGGGGDQPTIFYSRRIGLSGSRTVPVIGGARFTGTAGAWNIGAFSMQTDDESGSGAVETNFSVLRLRRNVLRRSYLGGIYTRRSNSTVAPGANDVVGLDANFGFFQNVYLATYVAKSQTAGRRGSDINYRAQFNYPADRYGLVLDRTVVEENFNPEIGFLRRKNFRRNFLSARFSPRTTNSRLIRRWSYDGSAEYTTDNNNHLETRELAASVELEFHNTDGITVQHSRAYEFLVNPFGIATGVTIPAGGYTFENTRAALALGQQHPVSGTAAFETGGFYGGDKETAAFSGRANLSSRLGVEPNVSFNWIDLPQGKFTNIIAGGRSTYTVSPQMFVALLVQYSSASKSLLTNLRLRWEYSPGSEFFVVFTEGRSTMPAHGTDLQNRGVVIKLNRLLRF